MYFSSIPTVKAHSTLQKYQMKRVFAVPVVNEKFQSERNHRHGAEVDRKNIYEFCRKAGFHVDKELKTHDITKKEIKDLFKRVSNQDFSQYDAFVCFISSHGNTDEIQGIDAKLISVEEIVGQFKGNSTLAGKPKLFFTQSCRGEKDDYGIIESDSVCRPIFHPSEADILVAWSCSYGYASYRNWIKGSFFISALIDVLSKHVHDTNLTDILTMVNHKIASRKFYKQMPCFTSSLRKAVYFEMPKSSGSKSVQPPPSQESKE